MAEDRKFEVRVGDFFPEIETIIDAEGIVRRVDKDAIITLPTPEQIEREGAVVINFPTLP
jgi:hypothetical protein